MTSGIHHVTAISGPAEENVAFYVRTLGLKLVKKTVNFDDPGTYHLYFGDAVGSPGTIMTFFPWANAARGSRGTGEVSETAFLIPQASLAYWLDRLTELRVPHEGPTKRFGASVVAFADPHGTTLALVAAGEASGAAASGDVPAEHAILGFHGVTVTVQDAAGTSAVLTEALGFREAGREGSRIRFAGEASLGAHVDLVADPSLPPARMGAGSVHHVAFRAASDAEQAEMGRRLARATGLGTTEQKDRNYFRSTYFRDPGGSIFEIATDDPGFAVDEAPDALGTALKLPPGLERHRAAIEAALPPLAA